MVGVDLFFVLSGFLITGILRQARSEPRYFRKFFARRTLRIFPLYFAALTVATLLLPALLPHNPRVQTWGQQSGWYWTYTANIAVALRGWIPTPFQGLDHFWSLAVEEQFYVLWPLAVWFFRRRTLIRLCVACALVSIGVRSALHWMGHVEAAFVLMPARMDALACGAVVALLAERPQSFARLCSWTPAAAGGTVVLIAMMIMIRGGFVLEDVLIQTLGYTLIAVAFAALLVSGLLSPPIARTLAWWPLRFFGHYSYGLYVIHVPLLVLIPPASLSESFVRQFGYTIPVARLAGLAAFAALCLALAVIIFHAYERPFLRLKERFERRTASDPQPAAGWPAHVPSLHLTDRKSDRLVYAHMPRQRSDQRSLERSEV
jgi:peptidoglycan/LPS O-acetylase OafA/YrhL